MRNSLLLVFVCLPFIASSQATVLSDDFESYTSGQPLAANSPLWTTWSGGNSDDANVSSTQASSGSNSVHLVGSAGPSDLVLPFPSDYTTGVYEFSLKMYMVSGFGGYFNIQASSVPGVEWMFEIYFDNAGGGYIHAGGSNAATVSYTPNSWTSVNVWVDLNSDLAKLYINSQFIHTWQWSLGALGSSSVLMMGGVNVYAAAANSGIGDFYVDNVLLTHITTTGIFVDDFERYSGGVLLAATSGVWTTWGGGVDAEDAFVNNEVSNSGFNSVRVTGNNGPTDLILPFPSDYTTGVYDFSIKMYVVNGYGAYFNIQESSVPAVGWMFEIYFDNSGGGYISAGGGYAAYFNYTPDAWTDVTVKMDLTHDLGECIVNGNSLHTWQWSLGAAGSGESVMAGGVDIFAFSAYYEDADFYVDDVLLTTGFPTSAATVDHEFNIAVTPNPSNGQFTLTGVDLKAGEYQLQLFDAIGRLVSSKTVSVSGTVNETFDVSAKGVYYLRLGNDESSVTNKIVIN